MQEERDYAVGGVRRLCALSRADRPWGHGLEVKTYDEMSSLLNEVVFVCHPEHASYEDLQAKSTGELVAIAVERLSSRTHEEALQQARQHGLKLFLSFGEQGPGPRLQPAS